MKTGLFMFSCFLATHSLLKTTAQTISSSRLRVEYLENPLNIDVTAPRFSWATEHSTRGEYMTAYELVVSSNGATVWDSGKVNGNVSTNVPYGGTTALTSDTDYSWTITWYDSTNTASTPVMGSFSTGLYNVSDWQGAVYIGGANNSNMLRSEFTITGQPTRARIYIVGLGYYKAWLNGQLTDDHQLGAFTTFEQRILYDTWDITNIVHEGCNALGIMLGNGWYSQPSVNVGPLSLMILLSVTTSAGVQYFPTALSSSDMSTTTTMVGGNINPLTFTSTPGPVLPNNDIYNGEDYDARLYQNGWDNCNFNPTTTWSPAVSVKSPPATSVLSAHTVPIRTDRDYAPINITQPIDSVYVIDFGQNMAGHLTVNVICPTGPQWIYFYFGESLHPDGTVLNQYGGIMHSNYTCAGTGDMESYTTLFSYYGFRFVQVTNFPGTPDEGSFMAHFAHSAVDQTGSLSTNNDLLNDLQYLARFASLSNLYDVPTDCPQRERRGWLGDAQLSCEVTIHNFDMGAFYTKWLRDIQDSQNFYYPSNKGQIPDCVPFYNHGGLPADPQWSVAFPAIVNWVSNYYNDDRLVEEYYDGIKDYIDSEIAQLNKGILSFARYGDWCSAADGPATSCVFTRSDISTHAFIKGIDILTDFANRLGNNGDAQKYGALANTTRDLYNSNWYHAGPPGSAYYSDGYPISQALALDLDLVPSSDNGAVFQTLVNLINNGSQSGIPMHATGGIIYQKYIYPVLTRNSRADLALTLLLADGFSSFQYWLNDIPGAIKATTLWENYGSTAFAPEGSYNHIMYGGWGSWLYTDVAGISRASSSRGWTNLLFNPIVGASPNVTEVSASIDSPIGLVAVDWTTNVANTGSCALAPENAIMNLTCQGRNGQMGAFTQVLFASFGTPSGNCPNFTTGSCNSPNSVSVVSAACIGKSSCSIPATNTNFGGDPCVNTLKQLAVSLAGNCLTVTYEISPTVPVGAQATVMVNTNGNNPNNIVIYEGPPTNRVPIWVNGTYVPGVSGVTGATVINANQVGVMTGSGTYTFAVSN